jgi:hypothetical protein
LGRDCLVDVPRLTGGVKPSPSEPSDSGMPEILSMSQLCEIFKDQ